MQIIDTMILATVQAIRNSVNFQPIPQGIPWLENLHLFFCLHTREIREDGISSNISQMQIGAEFRTIGQAKGTTNKK